jgi:hypothetical protein
MVNSKCWSPLFASRARNLRARLFVFSGSRYQGFTRISNDRLNEIEEDFGSIEGFIKEILEYEGDGLPGELLLAPDRSEEVAKAPCR